MALVTPGSSKPGSCCSGSDEQQQALIQAPAGPVDPVCGMAVDPATASASIEHEGQQYYFCCSGCLRNFIAEPHLYHHHGPSDEISPSDAQAVDPVCGMTVEIVSPAAVFDWQGQKYYFCCQSCATKFSTNPKAYLDSDTPAESMSELVPSSTSISGYTCPMHPEVVSDGPADCPDCGMPLEPAGVSSDDGQAEVDSLLARLRWTALFAIPTAVLAMAQMYGMGSMSAMESGGSHLLSCWLQMLLATPVVFWSARPFFEKALVSVRNRSLNMFTLLALGIAIPYVYSVVSLLHASFWGSAGISSSAAEHMVYFESSAVIALLAWLGQLLEAKARQRSTGALRELLSLAPAEATVVFADGTQAAVAVKEIALGALVRVAPGERIAVDGKVIEGNSTVDESMLTGETLPVAKQPQETVSAGTVNGAGSLLVEVQRHSSQTIIAQIAELVSQAQRSRVPVQTLADRASAVFVPLVLLVAALTAGIWLYGGATLVAALTAATSVLVVACPCALGLATPMSIIVASGRAARAGLLFKEARALQLLAHVDVIVLDKTGTLTVGVPEVVSIKPMPGFSEAAVLKTAAAVEIFSEHPLAGAIVQACRDREISIHNGTDFSSDTGLGAAATYDGKKIQVGSRRFLEQLGLAEALDAGQEQFGSTQSAVFVVGDGQLIGCIDFADKLRDNARKSVALLHQAGLKVVLASGDRQEVVAAAASACGISKYQAQMLPADKLELVKSLQAQGLRVAMAGDGINDSPALAQADVGIAIGSGTDIAMHSADIVLMNSDIRGIHRAYTLSRAMMTNIRQNLVLAFAYNLLTIPLAAGLLVPVIGFLMNPMLAAAFMSVSSVAVIANALRLRRISL